MSRHEPRSEWPGCVDIRLSSAYNTLLFMYIYKGRLENISANIAFLFYK